MTHNSKRGLVGSFGHVTSFSGFVSGELVRRGVM